jgi:hypothetical protein
MVSQCKTSRFELGGMFWQISHRIVIDKDKICQYVLATPKNNDIL